MPFNTPPKNTLIQFAEYKERYVYVVKVVCEDILEKRKGVQISNEKEVAELNQGHSRKTVAIYHIACPFYKRQDEFKT